MPLNKFLNGRGQLILEDKHLSLRIIKEALAKKFKIVVIEESPLYLSCKVKRLTRLYGAPIPFPNPKLELTIKHDNCRSTVSYYLISYDYYIVLFSAVVAGFVAPSFFQTTTLLNGFIRGILAFALVFLIYGTFVFVDTKYFTRLIRKALTKI